MRIPRRHGRKIVQWENTNEKPAISRSDIHAIDTVVVVEAKLATILCRLDSLDVKDKAN